MTHTPEHKRSGSQPVSRKRSGEEEEVFQPKVRESLRLQQANRAAGRGSFEGLTREQATAPIKKTLERTPKSQPAREALRRRELLLNQEAVKLEEPTQQEELPLSPDAETEKGFLTEQISTATGIAGGVVGSVLGPAGTIAGVGIGAALGEMLENVITGENLTNDVLKTATIDAALTATGISLFRTIKGLAKTAKTGQELITTGGLSNSSVSRAASGLFKKVDVLGTPIKTRIATTGKKFTTQVRIPINTVYANKVIRFISKLSATKKYGKLLVGMGGNLALNGFLDEEIIQNLDFEISKLEKAGETEAALTMIEVKEDIEDLDFWQAIAWLVPGSGAVKFMRNSAIKTSSQRRRLEKSLEEGKTQTKR